MGYPAAAEGENRPSLQPGTDKGGVFAPGKEVLLPEDKLLLRVNNNNIGSIANTQ